MADAGNKFVELVKDQWPLILAGLLFFMFLFLGASAPQPPGFMEGSGLESLLRLLESGQFSQLMDNPSVRSQFLQQFLFWLVLPLALVFVLVNYAINAAIQDTRFSSYGGHGSEKLALPVATILSLMLFASKQYTDVAAFVNGFGIAGVFIAFIAVIYLIGKTLWDVIAED